MTTINPEPGKVLRFLRHPLTVLVLGFALFTTCYVVSAGLSSKGMPWYGTPGQALAALVTAAGGIALYQLFDRKVAASVHDDFPLARAPGELAGGLGVGMALFSLMVAMVWLLGGIGFDGVHGIGKLWGMLALAILSGTYEEILFRGLIQRRLEQLLGTWAALAITSALFGLAHLFNPDATWFSSLAIALEAGILLGAAYLVTRRLWFPAALHAGWNFAQGWLFSAPVSGGKAYEGLIATHRAGPEWLTGGAFGLEASAVAMAVATGAGLALLIPAVRRGGLIKPVWQRNLAGQ